MKRPVCICMILWLSLSMGNGATRPPDVGRVRFEITRESKRAGVLHWKITNKSDVEVYVYDDFLLGPAFDIERGGKRVVFDATPIATMASCPPDRFPPVLLLLVRSGGTIEGDFSDPEIAKSRGKAVSLKIAVGSEPYSVVDEAKRLASSNCAHSPYDAIVKWGTILESTRIHVP